MSDAANARSQSQPFDKTALLRRSFLLSGAPDEALRRLAAAARERKVGSGQIILMEGDPGQSLFVIASGLVKVYVSSAEDGKELTLAFLEEGDVFGEIALLDGQPRSANVAAAEDAIMLELDRTAFFSAVRDIPDFAEHVFELICERFRNMLADINGFAFSSLRRRLAAKLVSLAVDHGQIEGDTVVFRRLFSQNELAQLLGVSREAVNRQLADWVKSGVISVSRGRLQIHKFSEIRQATFAE